MRQSLDPERERALVEQARHDPEAFRELYHYYFPRIYAYVASRVVAVPDVEDVVAEIFLEAVEGLDGFTYRGTGSFASWLFCIARNQVSDFHRRRQCMKQSVPLDGIGDLEDSEPLPDRTVVEAEQEANLRRLIATLSPRRQEVLLLKFFGGFRNQEIAEVLGLDERVVAAHLHRGLKALRRKYGEGGSLDGRVELWMNSVNG